MSMTSRNLRSAFVLGLLGLSLLSGCGKPVTVQRGYRGTGMQQSYDPATLAAAAAANEVPEPLPAASADGPKAGTVYQNVQVLGDLSLEQFTRVMLSMAQWVGAGDQSCGYCHQGAMSEDTLYTKVIARRMLAMTRQINGNWQKHVGTTGVTCYTCHRGQQIPSGIWFTDPGPAGHGIMATGDGKNIPVAVVNYSDLPYDPLTPFLLQAEPIRVQGVDAQEAGHRSSIKQAEWTYGLMTYMSGSLGVNCTYCHNTHAFGDWASSPPARATAWYGIRMVRDLNVNYLTPLTDTFPADQHGKTGDVGKVGCQTCHKGVYKPLYGVSMYKDYPELGPPATPFQATTTAAAPAGKMP